MKQIYYYYYDATNLLITPLNLHINILTVYLFTVTFIISVYYCQNYS